MTRVWAPTAGEVVLVTGGGEEPLRRSPEGWWHGPPLPAGADYGFKLDGDGPFPDPRSHRQPHGVHGLSRVVDHAGFQWTDARWQPPPLPAALIYELHVGTFSPEGTFDGALKRLDHLLSLGVTHVEVMPVNMFPGSRGWGYDGVQLFAPHEAYGGPEGFKRFVDGCHAQGLAVLLDVVYNHLGPDGNHLGRFGPYFTDRYGTPWGLAVNLDGPGSHEVRRFLIDNALYWLAEFHVDGLRLDAVHAIFDMSAIHFLEELSVEVAALEARLARHKVLVAESDLNDPRLVMPRSQGGYGLHGAWSDDLHHAIHALLTGESSGYYQDFGHMDHVARALCSAFVYDGRFSKHRQRVHGRPPVGLEGHEFVACTQNHDQVGNRARGERLVHLVGEDRARMAAAILMLSPFLPLVFQGEEWGAGSPFPYFTDHQDPSLARAVREGRREEFASFGWAPDDIPDPQAVETFLSAKLDWSEPGRDPHRGMLDWYRRLVALRRSRPELTDGRMDAVRVSHDHDEGWLRIDRGAISLALNMSPALRVLLMDDGARLLLAWGDVELADGSLSLPAGATAILERG